MWLPPGSPYPDPTWDCFSEQHFPACSHSHNKQARREPGTTSPFPWPQGMKMPQLWHYCVVLRETVWKKIYWTKIYWWCQGDKGLLNIIKRSQRKLRKPEASFWDPYPDRKTQKYLNFWLSSEAEGGEEYLDSFLHLSTIFIQVHMYLGKEFPNNLYIYYWKASQANTQRSSCTQLRSNWNENGVHPLFSADISYWSSVWDFSVPFLVSVFFSFWGLQYIFHHPKHVIPVKFIDQIKVNDKDLSKSRSISKTDTKLFLWIIMINSSIPFKAFSYVLNIVIFPWKIFKSNALCNHPPDDTSSWSFKNSLVEILTALLKKC